MSTKACMVLQNGAVFQGNAFGAETDTYGEVVFNTSMTGYQETLTDPSYAGQIVMPTYPLIGNYGTNTEDFESACVQVRGFIVRDECMEPNHYLSRNTLHDYLARHGIPGIYGLDTRAITRTLRLSGVMMGMIAHDKTPAEALVQLRRQPDYSTTDFVKQVTTRMLYEWEPKNRKAKSCHIIVLDCGLKYSILRILRSRGCRVTVVPATTASAAIFSLAPDGIVLSPGPGNPALLGYAVETIKQLVTRVPVMGICLGHQLLARAFGARTYKLKFGHRGSNHPVRDIKTGRVFITAQNHGFAVDPDSVGHGLEISQTNLNDNTVEGLRHRELPVFSIQYHSEASPGPLDTLYLFDEFIKTVRLGRVT